MKRKLWLFSIVTLVAVFIAIFVCQGVSAGGELAEMEEKITLLQKENIFLEKKIAQETSCEKLYEQAFNQTGIVALKR